MEVRSLDELNMSLGVYNELFLDYYKDIQDYSLQPIEEEGKKRFTAKLPVKDYSRAEISFVVPTTTSISKADRPTFKEYDLLGKPDVAIDLKSILESASNYFKSVNEYLDKFYAFKNVITVKMATNSFDNEEQKRKALEMYEFMKDKALKSLDECIKVSIAFKKAGLSVKDVHNIPTIRVFGTETHEKCVKLFEGAENVDYFQNIDKYELERGKHLSDFYEKSYQQKTKTGVYPVLDEYTPEPIVTGVRESKESEKKDKTVLDVVSSRKPKSPDKVKKGVRGKVGSIILGVIAASGVVYLANNAITSINNQHRIDSAVETMMAEAATPEAPVIEGQESVDLAATYQYAVNPFEGFTITAPGAPVYGDSYMTGAGKRPYDLSTEGRAVSIRVQYIDERGYPRESFVSNIDELNRIYSMGGTVIAINNQNKSWIPVSYTNINPGQQQVIQGYTR